jgi:hypothetical protein
MFKYKLLCAGVLVFCLSNLVAFKTLCQQKTGKYQVGVYYFPNYHFDKRNQQRLGKDWTEWKLIKEAKPRFPGHDQPKIPLWGYTDEADPRVMAQKINAASSHGINAFIFDWYYYNDGPFLETGLENGFMKAKNRDKMKFAIMWANHNWLDIFPATHGKAGKQLYPGVITPDTWNKMTDYIITKYFKNPSYWKINNSPYFSVYDLANFISIFGTTEKAAKAIVEFRKKTIAAGFRDLDMNAVLWQSTTLPGTNTVASPNEVVKKLGFNSVSSYVWIHHTVLDHFPTLNYDTIKNRYFKYALNAFKTLSVPYYPNVSMGWDPTPRTNQSTPWGNYGYPYTPVIVGNTPAAFKKALFEARTMLDKYARGPKVLTINSWNEWTEGSYIEPDNVHKFQYLDAIKAVFGTK